MRIKYEFEISTTAFLILNLHLGGPKYQLRHHVLVTPASDAGVINQKHITANKLTTEGNWFTENCKIKCNDVCGEFLVCFPNSWNWDCPLIMG